MLRSINNLKSASNIYIYIYIVAAILISFISLTLGLMTNSAHAATFDANINIKPSLSFIISTDTVALTLNPSSNAFGSQSINLIVGTNNINGYNLYMSSSTGSTNLVNSEDNTKYIETLDASASGYTESSFTADRWGYKKNSGNYFPFVSGDLISSSNGPVNNDITSLTLGAKVDYLAKAGTYELGLNFKVLPITTTTYMQNLSSNVCTTDPTVVIDARDEKAYTITRLPDGKCWMTSNLRFTEGTLSSTTSNVASTYTDANPYQINGNGTWGDLTDGGSWDEARLHIGTDSNGKPTVWYNYVGASAGSIIGVSNDTNSTYDICPKGWRLPTKTDFDGMTGYKSTFEPVVGGNYTNGSVDNPGTGNWWSSTAFSDKIHYELDYNGNILAVYSGGNRTRGFYVRCVLNETMQDFSSTDATAMNVGDTRTLTDSRDGNSYTIRKLPDNNVWMVQNLRYMGDTVGSSSTSTTWYLKSATSNVSADKEMTMTDLTSGDTYDNARFHNSGNTTTGVWYNYAAASAMTITGSSNTNTQTYDICPKNWRLPTNSEQSGITSYKDAFSPVTGGFYNNGSVYDTGYGYWWSATSYNSTYRYYLFYNGSSLGTYYYTRFSGYYVRCIKS